ncbi:VOC family protein [Sphingomonas sp. DT-51]|uniref:VOC family protein n=1 Tax=Sphingomonas sp. DT-51 TaxID=3396165 RepID=UPI003F1C2384
MTDREGLPIWYELLARDPDAAEDFYTHVLNWSVERPQLAAVPDYRVLAASDGDGVAGLMAVPPDAPMAPGWLFYLAADDVDATVERVTAAGGAVAMSATDIPEVGRIALVADPDGTPFYVMRASGEDESRAFRDADTATAGHAVWNELTAPDQDAALAFYAGLFGWRHEGAMPMGALGDYKFVHSGTICLGATMNSFAEKGPGWQFYFMVDDVDAAVERLTGAGGRVVQGPDEIPGGSFSVVAVDPEGAAFGFVGERRA